MDQHGGGREAIEHQLQAMDVYIVDVLANIEALLRHAHSMQRVLLGLRSEAPPPHKRTSPRAIAALREHAAQLQNESGLLQQIVQDLQAGVDTLDSTEHQNAEARQA
jgi:hypothetical protein